MSICGGKLVLKMIADSIQSLTLTQSGLDKK